MESRSIKWEIGEPYMVEEETFREIMINEDTYELPDHMAAIANVLLLILDALTNES